LNCDRTVWINKKRVSLSALRAQSITLHDGRWSGTQSAWTLDGWAGHLHETVGGLSGGTRGHCVRLSGREAKSWPVVLPDQQHTAARSADFLFPSFNSNMSVIGLKIGESLKKDSDTRHSEGAAAISGAPAELLALSQHPPPLHGDAPYAPALSSSFSR
jgi:hypothetical protein